jgi:predicted RNA binding protein YcfA (HicA-like mRNA interferase family)
MSKANKILEKMRNNPLDWKLSDLEGIADRLGIMLHRGKGSHVSFTHPKWVEILTVPAHNPIKPIYIKKFIFLIDSLEEI